MPENRFSGAAIVTVLVVAAIIVGCSKPASTPTGGGAPAGEEADYSGKSIKIDGSSTVFPVSMAVAEEYGSVHPEVKVPVKQSGTGGGMKQFTVGDIDICDASRSIKDTEIEACEKNNIEYVEFTVAFDGMAVVAHPENDWCDCITVEQLKSIWRPESDVSKWSDVNSEWPDVELKLYGPGTDSGTFEYFTEAVVGEARASRADFTASEDDNALVKGVASDKGSLGYFGYAYYAENKEQLKLLAVDNGAECVKPSEETVRDGTYSPLARPLFIYVSKESLKRPEVEDFVRFYLDNAGTLSTEVGYVPVTDEVANENSEKLKAALQ